MAIQREKIVPVYIEEEMKGAYLDYAMSVIVGRALPRVEDGLKPVHRRILYAMREEGLAHNRPHKKSATVVGDVLGKYHPHGDLAVYDALVRMVQGFSLRYPLVDGQGNFGSVDGDAAAAYRYTEVRLSQLAEEMLADIDKETVDFTPNFDGRLVEPAVLPSKLPNLLVNGSAGIAVGMATNIPSHNLSEVVLGLVALIDDPEIGPEQLMKLIRGPDFPTGGTIVGRSGIRDAYLTGRGRMTIRARAHFEQARGGRERIIVTEIPYQVNKASLIEDIASLVKDKKIDGIVDLRDESDRDGMRIVIELRRDANKEVVLNQLFVHTQMRTTFGAILLCLVDGHPKVLSLVEILELFLQHREVVVERRTRYELDGAEKRAHILEGLKMALDHIDEVVSIIRKSKDVERARSSLMKKLSLSKEQAQAILDMRLARLTSLERSKLNEEYLTTIKLISKLKGILSSRRSILEVVKDELLELDKRFGDERRTGIIEGDEGELTIEDLIADEDMVVTVTHRGYIKRLAVTSYKRQGRGGKGVTGIQTVTDDFPECLFVASTHSYVLLFTEQGRCHWLRVHQIPEGGRVARGRSIANLLSLSTGDRVVATIPVKELAGGYLVMATQGGMVKKCELEGFSNPRRGGIVACNVKEGDLIVDVKLTDGSQDIMLVSRRGQAIRFHESDVRAMGRTATGVRGMRLAEGDEVIGMVTVKRDASLLCVAENGIGKRTRIGEFRAIRRGGKGVIAMKIPQGVGLVAAREVVDTDELIIITDQGQVIRLRVADIRVTGRSTQGVRLIRLAEGDRVVDVAQIVGEE
jgi:DNA gyrase subunit A